MLNASIDRLTRDYAAIGQDAINAERGINQQLTNYVEQLEDRIQEIVVMKTFNHIKADEIKRIPAAQHRGKRHERCA